MHRTRIESRLTYVRISLCTYIVAVKITQSTSRRGLNLDRAHVNSLWLMVEYYVNCLDSKGSEGLTSNPGESKIQQELDGAVRNKVIFTRISKGAFT